MDFITRMRRTAEDIHSHFPHAPSSTLLSRGADEIERLTRLCAEWEAKAATWLETPEAAKRLAGYRELAQRLNAAETQRDNLLAAAEAEPAPRDFAESCLSPERNGYAVPAHVRDDARRALGLHACETITDNSSFAPRTAGGCVMASIRFTGEMLVDIGMLSSSELGCALRTPEGQNIRVTGFTEAQLRSIASLFGESAEIRITGRTPE